VVHEAALAIVAFLAGAVVATAMAGVMGFLGAADRAAAGRRVPRRGRCPGRKRAALHAAFGFVAVSASAALVTGMAVLVAGRVFFSRCGCAPEGSTAPSSRTMR
jgi:hypothetical protein